MKKRFKKITIHPFAKQLLLRFIGVFLIVCIAVALFLYFTSKPVVAEWFDSNWSYRQRINIPSHSSLENNVYVTVPSFNATDTTKFQADCGDLRFTKQNGQLLKYYVVDCDATANIHVLFDSLPAGETNYYMYYGNPAATNGFESADFPTAATGLGSQTAASEEVGSGPVAYWAFDEGQGQTINDGTQNVNNGTLGSNSSVAADDPTWQSEDQCISGKCLLFDGSDDFANIGNTTSLRNFSAITVSAWVKGTSFASLDLNTVFYKDTSGFYFGVFDGNVRFRSSDLTSDFTNGATTLSTNRWYFITATYSGSEVKIYVNGVLDATEAATGTISENSISANIGSFAGSSFFFNGFIDDVKIYPYARSEAQVKTDFQMGATSVGSAAVIGQRDTAFLNNGLLGYWKMDESSWNGTSNEVVDSSGNANHGTSTNAIISSGKFGNAGDFDGTDDNIDLSSDVNFTGLAGFTVGAWVNADDTATRKTIYNNGHGVFLELSSTEGVVARVRGTPGPAFYTPVGATTGLSGSWHHVAVVYTAGQSIKLYVDGQEDGSNTQGVTYAHSGTADDWIGDVEPTTGDYPFSGKIDEVRIYNRALSPKEVQDLYNWAPGPILHLNMDERNGTTAYDTAGSANTHHGTVSSGSPWAQGKYGSSYTSTDANSYLSVADSTDFNSAAATYEMWVNIKTPASVFGSDQVIAVHAHNASPFRSFMFFQGNSDDALGAYIYNQAGTSSFIGGPVLSTNTWYHLALSWDGTTTRLYVNGSQYGTDALSGTSVYDANQNFCLGSNNCAATFGFTGVRIDDVKVYNYARSSGQVIEDMNGGHPIGGSPVGSQLAYYAFDEQQGQTINNSGNGGLPLSGYRGTDTTATTDDPTWKTKSDCKTNGCLDFDGSTDFVKVPYTTTLNFGTTNFAISAWVKADTLGSYNRIVDTFYADVDGQRGYILSVNSSKVVAYVGSGTPNLTGNTTLSTGTWYHVALVRNGDTLSIYVNGKLDNSTTGIVSNNASTINHFHIGAEYLSPVFNYFWDGVIDEVKIYNTALTEEQVKIDMNSGASLNFGSIANSEASTLTDGAGNPPVAYWNFDEQTGTAANDKSGNGYTGTLTGGPKWDKGKIGAALLFNSTGNLNYVNVPNQVYSLTGGSLSMWIYPTATSELSPTAIGSYGGSGNQRTPTIYLSSNNLAWEFGSITDPTGVTSETLRMNTWYHVELTYDSSYNVKVYLDGKQVSSGTSASPGSFYSQIDIGRYTNGAENYPWSGKIDDVKIYNYARTPAQVAYDYNRGQPIGHWQFDECQGTTVNDSSENGYSGTWHGASLGSQTAVGTCNTSSTAWGNGATGKFNASLNFDGTDDYVDMGDVLDFERTSPFSISFWIKPSTADPSTAQRIISKQQIGATNNPGYLLALRGDVAGNPYEFNLRGTASSDLIAIEYAKTDTTNWTHIVISYTGSSLASGVTLYENGKPLTGTTVSDTLTATTLNAASLLVGARTSSTNFFSGQVDDVRIYSYPLSASQVKTLMNEGAGVRFGP